MTLAVGTFSAQIENVEGMGMKIDELRTLLEDLPADTLLTVATSPYDIWPVLDVRLNRDDSREDLCAACEVVFLAGDAWEDENPDDYDLTLAT